MIVKGLDYGETTSGRRALRENQTYPGRKPTLLAELRAADTIDWSRAVIDSASVRAVHAGIPLTAAKRAANTT